MAASERTLVRETVVTIPIDGAGLDADLSVPEGARAIVMFAHGSGSGRHSPRNRQVAAALGAAGIGTLLLDLLTPREQAYDAETRDLRFDVARLSSRLVRAADWLGRSPETSLPLGCYGASTGAAAALSAAAERPQAIRAVVSRGGRVDLAGSALRRVAAPCLFIVGERDSYVLDLNRAAAGEMPTEPEIEVIPGAGHLFEEPGALERVADRTVRWFDDHLDPS
jgi:putative phosphoribosyl transferase